MEKVESLNKFLRQLKKTRKELKYNRKEVWSKNKVNFRNNIKSITSVFNFPEGWNISIIASRFLLDRHTLPYDRDVWSFSDLIGATKNQGFDIVLFFNKTDLEFLSAPALLPIVIHEITHVFQAASNPEDYVKAGVNDELNKKYEVDADLEVKKYSDEFRRENILEKILFCFDERGWQGAKKMTDYLFKEAAADLGEDMIRE